MDYAVAVLDIGKTNKKVVVYDQDMKQLTCRKRKIETLRQHDLDIEDIAEIERWFLAELKDLSADYPIKALSVSTHGATVVCVDDDGEPVLPPVAYTNEVPAEVHERFWAAVGDPKEVQEKTATAEVKPLINLAKLLWYQKERWPEDFARIKYVLLYPQYFPFRLTGIPAADLTYTGCHSYLWDFQAEDWSFVVDVLGIRDKLPAKPMKPEEKIGGLSPRAAAASGLPEGTPVTVGIHDSNSSLVPYLITQKQDFVLNSTGTWCVAMHPADKVAFTPDELGKMVFYNLSFQGRPVKTSILLGGLEYEAYTTLLMEHHQREDWPGYDAELYDSILGDPSEFILPTVVPGTGQFPDSVSRVVWKGGEVSLDDLKTGVSWPSCFDDYQRAFALANLSLAVQSKVALERVGLEQGTEIFIEGGFRQNPHYARLLGALLPENPVYFTALEEATSFGAALCAKGMLDQRAVSTLGSYVELDKHFVEPAELRGLDSYARRFLELVSP